MNVLNKLTARFEANSRRVAMSESSQTRSSTRRPRDFGIGYGNSSGYASGKRYTQPWGSTRFVMG